MKNIKITLAYDGSSYFGWQKCKEGATIEAFLEEALTKVLRHPLSLQAASRTDRGVHAKGQIANFFTRDEIDLNLLKKALNCLLPQDIRILHLEEMPLSFHPTLDASSKQYLYTICNSPFQLPFHRNFSWHLHRPLSLEGMREKAAHFLGEHDFSPFMNQRSGPAYKDTCRTIYAIDIEPFEKNRIKICLTGNHFLYKMVRNLVGTMVSWGWGQRVERGVCAPARGLSLMKIFYELPSG